MSRVVRFEGIVNARDLGGLATSNGGCVAPGRLYRSASLHEMTDADRSTLEALGIGVIIDLRAEWERREHPYEWTRGRIVLAPLVDDDLVESITGRFADGSLRSSELEDWWELTRVFQAPEEHAPSIRTIFETLLEAEPAEGALFHCRGGKDRTGMVAALILEALGVTRAEVLADFLFSNEAVDAERVTKDFKAIAAARGQRPLSARARFSLTGVRPEWLDTLFRGIEDRYGSVLEYLTGHVGISPGDLARLRQEYVVPAAD